MRGITLQRLQVFCTVYERNSITGAARALGLSQPTVSKHLRDFEAASNLSLFVLDKGRVLPTAEADALYSESRFLQDGIDRLETRIDNLREGTGSKLAVMSIGLLMPGFVPDAIARLMQRMPKLRLSIDIAISSRQIEGIRSGNVDLGIMAGHIATEEETVVPLGQGRLVALVPRSSPVAKEPVIDLKTIAALPTVDSTPRGPIGRILDEAMRSRGLASEGKIMCNSLIAVPYMAQALGRVAILDEFTAKAHPQPDMDVKALRDEITFPIMAVSRSPTGSRVAMEHLTGFMRDALCRPERPSAPARR